MARPPHVEVAQSLRHSVPDDGAGIVVGVVAGAGCPQTSRPLSCIGKFGRAVDNLPRQVAQGNAQFVRTDKDAEEMQEPVKKERLLKPTSAAKVRGQLLHLVTQFAELKPHGA